MTSVKVVKATKPFLSGSKILSLCAIALASLLTFQYHTNTQNLAQFTSLENSIANLESKISGIDTYLKELGELIKQQNVQSQNYYDQSQESTPENRVLDGGVYDIQGHAPHSRYLNNIETLKDDPRTPVDPLREYTYDDFQSVFEVEPLHKVEITKEAAEIIDNHNVTDDNYYITWPEEIKELQVKFAGFLDADSLEQRDREYMVVKWVSPLEGFGVFANKDIKEGELIGRYTGEIVRDIQDTGTV